MKKQKELQHSTRIKGGKSMLTEIDEFKGNKVIKLKRSEDDQYPFTFGVKKAELIIANIDAIKDFVESNKEKTE